jgi:hypothetical protein
LAAERSFRQLTAIRKSICGTHAFSPAQPGLAKGVQNSIPGSRKQMQLFQQFALEPIPSKELALGTIERPANDSTFWRCVPMAAEDSAGETP